ncbi:unnamed protein product, partial [Ectocarpus sp. 13 AM-2016]
TITGLSIERVRKKFLMKVWTTPFLVSVGDVGSVKRVLRGTLRLLYRVCCPSPRRPTPTAWYTPRKMGSKKLCNPGKSTRKVHVRKIVNFCLQSRPFGEGSGGVPVRTLLQNIA